MCVYFSLYNYDILFVIAIDIFIIACFIFVIFFSSGTKTLEPVDDVALFMTKQRDVWMISDILWLTVSYAVQALSLLTLGIVIYIGGSNPSTNERVLFYSILSFIFTALALIVNPQKVALGYRKAYEKMAKAVLLYQDKTISKKEIIEIFDSCEKSITKYSFI